ncbi:hypothetical protein [Streptomyces sp. SGAir0957]
MPIPGAARVPHCGTCRNYFAGEVNSMSIVLKTRKTSIAGRAVAT